MLPWFNNQQFPVYLAPMARYTDAPYRQLCKDQGADVMVTEFVRAESLLYGGPEAWRAIDFTESQRPMGVQIFGANADSMAEAARRIVDRVKPDFIDLNFGCPAHCVTDKQAGASLLKQPIQLARIAKTVVDALPDTPVTAKMRIGWDRANLVACEVGLRLQESGVQALVIHGRTKVQGYRGEADWPLIEKVATALDIPVVGNGDITTPHQVKRLRDTSPVAGVMIGRGALGYPWLFNEIKSFLKTGHLPEPPNATARWATLVAYAHLLLKQPYRSHDTSNIRWMHPKLKALTKNMPGCKRLRVAFESVTSIEDLEALKAREEDQ